MSVLLAVRTLGTTLSFLLLNCLIASYILRNSGTHLQHIHDRLPSLLESGVSLDPAVICAQIGEFDQIAFGGELFHVNYYSQSLR